MKKTIILVALLVLLGAGYLSFFDEKHTSLDVDSSSRDIVLEKQALEVSQSSQKSFEESPNQATKQGEYRIMIKSSDGKSPDREMVIKTDSDINNDKEYERVESNESSKTYTTSSLDVFLTGEADFLFIDDTDELHQYLLDKWDGKADFIEDGIYDIEVSALGTEKDIILFDIRHKQRSILSAEEFRDTYLPEALAKLNADPSYGEYSSDKELLVMNIADSISTSTEDIFIHSLTCYEFYCVFFVETANGELFTLFEQKIRAIENAFLSLFKSRDNNNYGIFKLSFK